MPSIINASTTSTSGLVYSADASGVLQLQSNGVTGLTVGTGGLLTAANGMVFSSMTLGTAAAGEFEYDGRVPYFTPLGTQRGVIPGQQLYALTSGVVGSNATGAQSLFGVGVTLSSGTIYAFEINCSMVRTAGTTSHTLALGFGGTATLNSINYTVAEMDASNSAGTRTSGAAVGYNIISSSTATVVSAALSSSTQTIYFNAKGIISVNAGGTLLPQYTLSAAPGGAYTTLAGSYVLIYPIGAAGSNVSVGTWA